MERTTQKIFEGEMEGKRPREIPRLSWIEIIIHTLHVCMHAQSLYLFSFIAHHTHRDDFQYWRNIHFRNDYIE